MLAVHELSFHFDTRPVFTGFSADIGAGLTWLRGPNGAGKTTLLKLLGGALRPHGGHVKLQGLDSEADALAFRQQAFYCGGDTPELPWLTVREWLDLYLALYAGTQAEPVNAQLQAFGLMDTLPQAVNTLSLGQHKKLQLALALSLPVKALLVDEPFNGLDAAAMPYLLEQLAQCAQAGQCIVLTSHLEPRLPVARVLDL